MKYIRYASDIHLDHDKGNLWYPIKLEGDEDTTYIIAGDLWRDCKHISQLDENGESWIGRVSKQFKYVVYVLGNHDYWGGRLDTSYQKCKDLAIEQGLTNVFILENSSITLDGHTFVGGTLWTDYGDRNPISMMEAKNYMNDYRLIRFGENYHKMTPIDCLKIFDATKRTIFKTPKPENGGKLFVVTHMAPSYQSVNEVYRTERDKLSNTWYYSELGNSIADSEIDYWLHGHTHHACAYAINKTLVLCNPRGYVNYESDVGFNEVARITLGE